MSGRCPVQGRRRGEEATNRGKGDMIMGLKRRKGYLGMLLDSA